MWFVNLLLIHLICSLVQVVALTNEPNVHKQYHDEEKINNNTKLDGTTLAEDLKWLRHPISRVYGGNPIPKGRYQYAHASLLLKGNRHQCGGTFVAPDILLSAAHCYDWFDTIRIAEYGTNNNNFIEGKTSRSATTEQQQQEQQQQQKDKIIPYGEVYRHELFNPETFENDIMVIQLQNAIHDVQPIKMNQKERIPLESQSLTVVGWGKVDGQEDFPDELHHALVPYVNNYNCENKVHQGKQLYKGEIKSSMLCAGGDGVDACRGDSGSPLVVQTNGGGAAAAADDDDLLVGLVSWGRGCAIYPGVYVRISSFYEWSREHICYLSRYPPDYLQCKPNERGSYQLNSPTTTTTTSSTAPSRSPIFVTIPPSSNNNDDGGVDYMFDAQSSNDLDEASDWNSDNPLSKERSDLTTSGSSRSFVFSSLLWISIMISGWAFM